MSYQIGHDPVGQHLQPLSRNEHVLVHKKPCPRINGTFLEPREKNVPERYRADQNSPDLNYVHATKKIPYVQ